MQWTTDKLLDNSVSQAGAWKGVRGVQGDEPTRQRRRGGFLRPSRLWGFGGASWAPPAGTGAETRQKRISVLSKLHRMPVVETFVIN